MGREREGGRGGVRRERERETGEREMGRKVDIERDVSKKRHIELVNGRLEKASRKIAELSQNGSQKETRLSDVSKFAPLGQLTSEEAGTHSPPHTSKKRFRAIPNAHQNRRYTPRKTQRTYTHPLRETLIFGLACTSPARKVLACTTRRKNRICLLRILNTQHNK